MSAAFLHRNVFGYFLCQWCIAQIFHQGFFIYFVYAIIGKYIYVVIIIGYNFFKDGTFQRFRDTVLCRYRLPEWLIWFSLGETLQCCQPKK